jgi:hypothetical protein
MTEVHYRRVGGSLNLSQNRPVFRFLSLIPASLISVTKRINCWRRLSATRLAFDHRLIQFLGTGLALFATDFSEKHHANAGLLDQTRDQK